MAEKKKSTIGLIGAMSLGLLAGCNKPASKTIVIHDAITPYPARPATPAPPFTVFHHDASTFTLVTSPNVSDTDIAALIYQLRDAAHTHTLDSLHISQTAVDTRDPAAWFHIYRGPKCAAEKYVPKPPCGASYHAAGDYTFGSIHRKDWDDGILLHGEDHETPLWNPDAPYTH